jgi:arylsulfatase A-like enzyme
MDWLPTVMELCGIERQKDDPELDGHSVLPLIRSTKAESGYGDVLHFQWHTQWAVRKGEWKLIGRGTKPSFLGNLNDEQPEGKNYLKEKPELVSRLLEMRENWAKEVVAE